MRRLQSYAVGRWVDGAGTGTVLRHAVTGAEVAVASSAGLDVGAESPSSSSMRA